jgi:hypothetical protein
MAAVPVLGFDVVKYGDKKYVQTKAMVSSKKYNDFCRPGFNMNEDALVRMDYIKDLLTDDTVVIILAHSGTTEIGFSLVRPLKHSMTMDVFCTRKYGVQMINRVKKFVLDSGPQYKRLRLYAVSQRILYFRNQGFVISHHAYKETTTVKSAADKVQGRKKPLNTLDAQNDSDYTAFLRILIDNDMLRRHFSNVPLSIVEPFTDDTDGYAMLFLLQ